MMMRTCYNVAVKSSAPISVFDTIKPLDPLGPDKEPQQPVCTGTIFDYYKPTQPAKPDINERCYWDKRTLKIKEDIERSAARAAENRRREREVLEREYTLAQVAESANRRSGSECELYLL